MRQILKYSFGVLVSLCAWSLHAQTDIQTLVTLPQSLKETSGLLFYNGKLIMHNDSGNASELNEFDTNSLEITRTVRIANAENVDWEDLTQDDDFIYIGDIGNNSGDRLDLSILRIAKTDYDTNDVVNAERISFLYEDQTDFSTTTDSDFDAEALFSIGDDLVVLTKQWQSQGTVAYRIPKSPGSFLAEPIGSYQVNGLVAGAAFDSEENTLYLVGYSSFLSPFFVAVSEVSNTAIFGSGQDKVNLSIGQAQVEAITFWEDIFYVTSEEFMNPPLLSTQARLFSFTLDGNEEEVPIPNPEENTEPIEGLVVYKSFGSPQLFYELNTDRPIFARGIFDIQGRLIDYIPLERFADGPIDISKLNQGLYILAFFYGDSVISSPFFRD